MTLMDDRELLLIGDGETLLRRYGRLRRKVGSVPADGWTDDELLSFWRAYPQARTENMSDAEVIAGLRSGQDLTSLSLDYSRTLCINPYGYVTINMPRPHGYPAFEFTGSSFLVDSALQPSQRGDSASSEARFLAVPIRSTAGAPLRADIALEITDAGRDELARHQIFVCDAATAEDALVTGQEFVGRDVGVALGWLGAGEERTVYFPVHAVNALDGKAEVEFVLYCAFRNSRCSWSTEVHKAENVMADQRERLHLLPAHVLAIGTLQVQGAWLKGAELMGVQVVRAAPSLDPTSVSPGISGLRKTDTEVELPRFSR